MKKLRIGVLALSAMIGSVAAFATHSKTVATPLCSEVQAGDEECANFNSERCCHPDDNPNSTIYGPKQPL